MAKKRKSEKVRWGKLIGMVRFVRLFGRGGAEGRGKGGEQESTQGHNESMVTTPQREWTGRGAKGKRRKKEEWPAVEDSQWATKIYKKKKEMGSVLKTRVLECAEKERVCWKRAARVWSALNGKGKKN